MSDKAVMTGAQVRQRFLDYFAERGHKKVASSSLLPHNDPTLLFTNAGMNQFKDIFTGQEKSDFNRATTCQKCLRVSGKHNDLENVGRTARHHTFFEMLGNFSFGDYFKQDAIRFGWEFLTVDMGLNPDKLWITIFEDDDEAERLWLEETPVPAERIVRCGEKDNFWAMGDTGPCGPCSEIHYDQGPDIYPCPDPDNCGPECDCDRYLELWNLVFMQFERSADGTMTPLPKPSIDTGMGLERVTAVVQGALSNYDTDLFRSLIDFTAELKGIKYGDDADSDVSLRVVADHIRASVFLIADGVLPSNEGRGYVLRRVMRRAMRHGRLLGFEETFFYKVAAPVIDSMAPSYSELADKRDYIAKVIHHEEERFNRTIDRGLQLLENEVDKLDETGGKVLDGEVVFKLYDTFGFPVDLTEDIVIDRGITLDMAGFDTHMQAQKDKARQAWKGSGEEAVGVGYRELRNRGVASEFVGYEGTEVSTEVVALLVGGEEVAEAPAGAQAEVVLAKNPFYGESGGQVGDSGELSAEGLLVSVLDAQKPFEDMIVLKAKVETGTLVNGAEVLASTHAGDRFATAQNHSATHLLQEALRRVLGDHVKQSGSLVGPERLRFDFTHFAPVTAEELKEVESLVNGWVSANLDVATSVEDYEEAVGAGVTALFGEKYSDKVRVVRMGEISSELCGGTHAHATGEVGFFKILSETGVAAGVRRIEGATGGRALEKVWADENALARVAELVKATPEETPEKVTRLIGNVKELEKEISQLRTQLASGSTRDILSQAKEINGVRALATIAPVNDPKGLREFADGLRDRMGSGAVAIGAEADNKAILLVAVTKDLAGKVHAGQIVKVMAEIVGGRGGGRPDMAQAGGPDPSKLDAALEAFYDEVEKSTAG